jgi:alkylhydroperoxidase family enzyme
LQQNQTALLAENLEASYGSIEGYAAALNYSEEETQELITKTGELGASLADFINPLGTYTTLLDEKAAAEEAAAIKAAESAGAGADAWRDFVTDSGFSFDEYMVRLREQVTAQEDWQLNMLLLAGRVSQGTLDELARMGPEGAPLVADLVNQSDAVLDEFDDITARRAREATDAWGAQMTLAAPVLAAIGRTAGQGVVDELAAKLRAGTTTVAEIAAQYGVNLAGGINPILTALGRRPIGRMAQNPRGGFFEADGGVVDYYANGGFGENHVAQIARAGDWRVWAEPETGGPAFIPLAHHRSNGDQS